MRSNHLEQSEARLTDLRRHLEREVEQVGAATSAAARVRREPGDDADQASDRAGHEAEAGVLSVLVHSAGQVDRALELLQGGLYGRCEDCGQEIPAERLEILPEATRCLACQMRFDQRSATTFSA
jgi:RNA polymerase-binding transcription factor DksA